MLLPTAAIFVNFAYLRNFRGNTEKGRDLQTLPGKAQTCLGLSFILKVMFKMELARDAVSASAFLGFTFPSSCHLWLESGWAELDLSILKHIALSAQISREKDKRKTKQTNNNQKITTILPSPKKTPRKLTNPVSIELHNPT